MDEETLEELKWSTGWSPDYEAENESNRNKAKGLFSGIMSGKIVPTPGVITDMLGSAWRGWVDTKTNYQTGTPTILPTLGSYSLVSSGINYALTPAEQAARLDYLKELRTATDLTKKTKQGLRVIAGSGEIPQGTVANDWMLPKHLLQKVRPRKVRASQPTTTQVTNQVTNNKIYRNTSKLEDRNAGVNGKVRNTYKNAAAMETKDGRAAGSGFTGVKRGRRVETIKMISRYPEWEKPYNKLMIKIANSKDPKRTAMLKRQLSQLLEEFRNKMGY